MNGATPAVIPDAVVRAREVSGLIELPPPPPRFRRGDYVRVRGVARSPTESDCSQECDRRTVAMTLEVYPGCTVIVPTNRLGPKYGPKSRFLIFCAVGLLSGTALISLAVLWIFWWAHQGSNLGPDD
jgi:hypothetical protein